MSIKKHMPIAIMVAVIAAALQVLDQFLQAKVWTSFAGFGWISFQAWAMYFISGCSPKGGMRTFIGYFLGVVGSVLIFTMGGWFGSLGFWAMPVTLIVMVIVLMQLEIAPEMFSYVPAVFVGAGAFFGICSYIPVTGYLQAGIIELVYCFIGLFCGYLTISFNSWYIPRYVEKKGTKAAK